MASPVTVSEEVSRAVRKMTGTSLPSRAEPAADLEAVHVRQHHVEHDQVGRAGVRLPQRLLPGGRGGHRAAVELQRDLDQLADVRLVVDDEHLGNAVLSVMRYRGSFCARRVRPWCTQRHPGLRIAPDDAGQYPRPAGAGDEPDAELPGAGAGRLAGRITISRASSVPLTTGPATKTAAPSASALALTLLPFCADDACR